MLFASRTSQALPWKKPKEIPLEYNHLLSPETKNWSCRICEKYDSDGVKFNITRIGEEHCMCWSKTKLKLDKRKYPYDLLKLLKNHGNQFRLLGSLEVKSWIYIYTQDWSSNPNALLPELAPKLLHNILHPLLYRKSKTHRTPFRAQKNAVITSHPRHESKCLHYKKHGCLGVPTYLTASKQQRCLHSEETPPREPNQHLTTRGSRHIEYHQALKIQTLLISIILYALLLLHRQVLETCSSKGQDWA